MFLESCWCCCCLAGFGWVVLLKPSHGQQLLVFWLEGHGEGIFCVVHLIEGAVGSSSGLFLQEFAGVLAISCWSS